MSLSLEDQFLLVGTRVGLGTVCADELQVLCMKRFPGRSLNWEHVLAAALRHAIAPLIARGLEPALPGDDLEQLAPSLIRAELAASLVNARKRNEYLIGIAQDVAEAFASAHIDVLTLKDLGFVSAVFSDVGLRPIGDLDLLIHQGDFARAAGCLRVLDFMPLDDARHA